MLKRIVPFVAVIVALLALPSPVAAQGQAAKWTDQDQAVLPYLQAEPMDDHICHLYARYHAAFRIGQKMQQPEIKQNLELRTTMDLLNGLSRLLDDSADRARSCHDESRGEYLWLSDDYEIVQAIRSLAKKHWDLGGIRAWFESNPEPDIHIKMYADVNAPILLASWRKGNTESGKRLYALIAEEKQAGPPSLTANQRQLLMSSRGTEFPKPSRRKASTTKKK